MKTLKIHILCLSILSCIGISAMNQSPNRVTTPLPPGYNAPTPAPIASGMQQRGQQSDEDERQRERIKAAKLRQERLRRQQQEQSVIEEPCTFHLPWDN